MNDLNDLTPFKLVIRTTVWREYYSTMIMRCSGGLLALSGSLCLFEDTETIAVGSIRQDR